MRHAHPLPRLLALLVLAACDEDQSPTAPTSPAEPGGPAYSHTAGHKVVNSLADPGNGTCNATQCTLREAITDPGSTEISFAPGLTGAITLAGYAAGGGRLSIDKRLSITGPSQRIVIRRPSTVSAFPIFRIGVDGTVKLVNLTIRDGGILNRGTLTLINCVVAGTSGAGIFNASGTVALTKSFVVDNSSAGIDISQGTATLTNTRVAGNSASGIRVSNATVTLTNSTVAGNSATTDGGGISNSNGGIVTLIKSTVVGNSAPGLGGGVFNNGDLRQGAGLVLTNSTVSGNSALVGGGIFNSGADGAGEVFVTNSTVARNSAAQEGGGIFHRGHAFLITNTLVAQNSARTGPDVLKADGGEITARFSLIGNGSGSGITNTNGNQVGNVPPNTSPINPRLGALADNGGPTRTHALLLDSPAIDAASTPDCPTTDQRGVLRPQGAACDIGSYERK
jgi:CSLREA domain-containing protein